MAVFHAAQRVLDRVAVGFSAACAVHCVLMPVALVMLPALGTMFVADEAFHRMMLWLILPTSMLAVALGCRRHKDIGVFVAAMVGLGVLVVTALFGHDLFGEVVERVATVVGAAILSLGHIRNYRLCRQADCCHDA